MSSEWNEITLGEFADINPSRSINKQSTTPFIEMAAIQSYTRDVPLSMITNRLFNGSGSKFKNGDVLLARITPCLENGKTALVSGLNDCFGHGSTELIVLRAKDDDDISYLYYLLISDLFRGYAIPRMEGTSGRQRVPNSAVAAYKFFCPPPKVRKDVGATLRALDDRIAFLRETNTTLEAIAQTLFKSWFVDFDPVRAKQEGREPEGMDADTAALFPDSFEESELGLVPKGWKVGVLGDIAVSIRKQIPTSELNTELSYIGLEHMPRQSLSICNWDNAQGLESAKAAFSKGDILFGKLRPYFHKVIIAPFEGVCSTDILVCHSKQSTYYGIITMHLFSVKLVEYANRLSNGAKMPRVNWKDIAAYTICIPSSTIANKYSNTVIPLFERMMANVHTTKTLESLRDTLLPRLISGQLRIPEAEALIEEATV